MQNQNWRQRDLRGDGPVPSSVCTVVHRTRLALVVARWGESVLFALAALLTTLAALTVCDVNLARLDAWIAATISAVACGLAWRLEHSRSAGQVAHELDRRLRHQGGLVTAYELESVRTDTAMTRLLRARVLARLRPGDALRAMFPPLPLPVAAPLVGAGLLALALESRRAPEGNAADLGALAQGLVAAVDGLESEVRDRDEAGAAGVVDTRTLREVHDVVARARALGRRAGRLLAEPVRAAAELEELDRDLAALSTRLADAPTLRAHLEEARNWADAAHMGLADAADGSAGAGPAEPGASPDGAVTGAGGDGTMSAAGDEQTLAPRRPAADAPNPDGSGVDSEVAEDTGTVAGTFWPSEYDGIVSAWIELRRRTSEKATR